jgi:hypothetical protein
MRSDPCEGGMRSAKDGVIAGSAAVCGALADPLGQAFRFRLSGYGHVVGDFASIVAEMSTQRRGSVICSV